MRFYSYSKKRLVTQAPVAINDGRLEAVKKDALYKLPQLWLFKVLWYGSVSMEVIAKRFVMPECSCRASMILGSYKLDSRPEASRE